MLKMRAGKVPDVTSGERADSSSGIFFAGKNFAVRGIAYQTITSEDVAYRINSSHHSTLRPDIQIRCALLQTIPHLLTLFNLRQFNKIAGFNFIVGY